MNSDSMIWTVLGLFMFRVLAVPAVVMACELFLAMVPFAPNCGGVE